jgi:tetratricopeptide (TPR) repeat protein
VSEIPNDIKRGFGSGWAKSQINSYLNATTWRPFAHERFVQLQTQLQTELLVEQRISALNEQYNLLKGYSRWQKAEKLMADTIIPLVVANDPLANQTNLDIITKHMLHLFSVGKYDQFDALVKVLVPLVDAFPKRTKSDRWVENRIKYQDIEFGQVMLMIKALQDQDEMELPKLVSSQRTTDGFVILEFQTPKAEYKIENDQTLTGYQMWQMDVSTGENMLTHLAFPGKDPRTIYVIIKTDMKQATLAAKFRLCNGNFYPHGEVRKSCPMGQIKLPTEPTIATSKQWWGEHAADKKLPFYMQGEEQSVYNKLNHQAFEALKEKDYQAALEVYEQLLALPKADWPEYMFTSWIYGAYLAYEWERGSIQSQIDKCQIRLGNHEQVLSRIKQELAQAPSMGPDDTGFIKPEVIWIHQHLRAGLLEWASFLIEQGKFDQAQTFLDDMAKDLPDLSKYLREYVPIRFHTPDGGETIQSCNPNWDVRRSWHPYEKTLWDLHDARKAQTVDKK